MTRKEKRGLYLALLSLYFVAIATGLMDVLSSLLLLSISTTFFLVGLFTFLLSGKVQ